MNTITKLTAATALSVALLANTALAQTSQPFQPTGSTQSERVLSAAEINDLVRQAQQQGYGASSAGADVRYVGGSNIASETNVCCENVVEQVETRTELRETNTFVDAVTEREIITPQVITTIQPIERRRAVGRVESVTEDTVFEENRLPVRVERDPVPQLQINTNEDVRYETREQRTETVYDAVGRREVIQPIVRTTVVPVQRRITRNRDDVQTLETRYEQVVAPARVNRLAVPQTIETYSTPTTEEYREDVTETTVDYVSERNIYQERVVTDVQAVERQILRPQTDFVTGETIYREEVLASNVIVEPAPAVQEVYIPQVSEQTVFEVEDVYIDQINRRLIQPVVITTIEPVENQVLNGRRDVVENNVVYTENRLALRVEADPIPQTQVNYFPTERREFREEMSESYFDATTRREVTQPVVITQIQPVEVRRPSLRTETVTAPTQYETVRASMVVMNVGGGCNCDSVN